MQTYSNVASALEGKPAEQPMSVLVADDDPQEHLLITMAAQLYEEPLTIGFVPDGSDLLRHLARVHQVNALPDIIVLDLRMPGFDGWRTLGELESHEIFSRIPVVVFTSSARLEDEAAAYEFGAVGFQTKPSTFEGMERFLTKLTNYVAKGNGFQPQSNMDAILSFVNADLDSDVEDELLVEAIDLNRESD